MFFRYNHIKQVVFRDVLFYLLLDKEQNYNYQKSNSIIFEFNLKDPSVAFKNNHLQSYLFYQKVILTLNMANKNVKKEDYNARY